MNSCGIFSDMAFEDAPKDIFEIQPSEKIDGNITNEVLRFKLVGK
jgi:hypothetical protein